MKKNNLKKGIAPIIIILVLAALAGGGSAVYLKSKNKPLSIDSVKENILGTETKEEAFEDLQFGNADLDISSSPIPKLEISSFDIGISKIEAPKIGNIKSEINLDVGIKKENINIGMPNISNMMPKISIPTSATPNIPTSMPPLPPDMGGVSVPPNAGSVPSEAPAGTPAIDCGMFASVPSCSYVPAGQAQDACKKCFPGK